MYGRGESSRLRTAVRRAIQIHGGRLTTRDAAEVAYPDSFIAGLPLNERKYGYLRVALARYAQPVGRSRHGSRPILWQAK
jgi:hypothetical protein